MSAASNYLETQLFNLIFRGVAFTPPAKTWIALHTADPTETGSAAEVSTSTWPSYLRQDAAKGGAQADAWTVPSDGTGKNALQLIYAMYDGAAPLTVTHFSVWDAQTGGNMLVYAPLASSRTINNGDVFVVDAQKLTGQVL
jgi:hypothetical protein